MERTIDLSRLEGLSLAIDDLTRLQEAGIALCGMAGKVCLDWSGFIEERRDRPFSFWKSLGWEHTVEFSSSN